MNWLLTCDKKWYEYSLKSWRNHQKNWTNWYQMFLMKSYYLDCERSVGHGQKPGKREKIILPYNLAVAFLFPALFSSLFSTYNVVCV